MKKRMSARQRAVGEPIAFFFLSFDDLVIQGIDALKCL
jgi:hypothetical protein